MTAAWQLKEHYASEYWHSVQVNLHLKQNGGGGGGETKVDLFISLVQSVKPCLKIEEYSPQLSENPGGCTGLPVPNSPYSFCVRKATMNSWINYYSCGKSIR